MFRLENGIIGDLRLERSGNLSAARVNGAAMLDRLFEIRLPFAELVIDVNVGICICAASRSTAIFLAKGRARTKEIRRRGRTSGPGMGDGSIDAGGKPYKTTPARHGGRRPEAARLLKRVTGPLGKSTF